MKRCASCGASYDEDRSYCPECGVAADARLPELSSYDAEHGRGPDPEPKPEPEVAGDPGARKHAIALLAAVALVVVGVVAYVVVRNPDDDDDRRAVPPPTSSATVATTPPTSSTPATTTNPPPPEDRKVGLVSIPAALTEQPRAMEVAQLLNTYFSAINGHDFETWKSVLMPVEGRDFEGQWKGLETTHDSDIKLFHVDGPDGSMTADVSFTSRQDPDQGPRPGETCTDWDVTYLLVRNSTGTLLIDRVDESRTTNRECRDQ